MDWTRKTALMIESSEGYRVSKSMVGDVAQYAAWAPDCGYDALKKQLRVQYAMGEAVPVQRACLGVFASSDAARAVCETTALRVNQSAVRGSSLGVLV